MLNYYKPSSENLYLSLNRLPVGVAIILTLHNGLLVSEGCLEVGDILRGCINLHDRNGGELGHVGNGQQRWRGENSTKRFCCHLKVGHSCLGMPLIYTGRPSPGALSTSAFINSAHSETPNNFFFLRLYS